MTYWNRLKQLTVIGLLLVLGACGGGGSGSAVVTVNPTTGVATVVITSDAQGAAPPTVITATFSVRVIGAPANYFVIGGTCAQLPSQISTLDATGKIVTTRLSGAICAAGQTLTLTLDASKIVLENATLASTAVWSPTFTIVAISQKIGGAVNGLNGVVGLKNNAGETLLVSSNGAFSFPALVDAGQPYSVTVASQPTGQTCSVNQGSGVVGIVPVDTVAVVCASNSFKVSGTVSGLSGALELLNNGGDVVTVTADGFFTFPAAVASGAAYAVTVRTQPASQTCTVSSGSGVIGSGAPGGVTVVCSVNSFNVSGTVSGLVGTVNVRNNGGPVLAVSANGAFTFPAAVAFGSPYAVTISNQPLNQTCVLTNGTGTMAAAPVNNVTLVCTFNSYSVSGTVSGLVGTLSLNNNAGPVLTVTTNGTFTFPAQLVYNSPYAVTIGTQPLNQTCVLTNGAGTVTGTVSNVTLACATSIFSSGNTYNGTPGAADIFTGPIGGLNASTFAGNPADTDAITLTTAGVVTINNGSTGGTLSNIKVLNLANGTNTITFSLAGVSGIRTVVGGTGDDSVDLTGTGNAFLAATFNLGAGDNTLKLENKVYTGTFTAGSGTDTLYVFNGTDTSGATLTGFENLVVSNGATFTMTPTQLSQFTGTITAAGTETINLSTAGTFTAFSTVENYNLANGTNNFTSANVAVAVAGGSGNDTFNFTTNQFINFLTSVDGGGGSNTLNIGTTTTQNIDLTAGNKVSNIQTINVAGSLGTASVINLDGPGVTLNYTKSTGDNIITLGTGGQTLNVLGSSNAPTIITGGAAVDTINLPTSGSGSETLIETGGNMSNRTQIDTVGNFNATGTDYFKTGVNAASVGSYIISNADTSNYLTTIASGLSFVLNSTGQAYLITIQTGTAAGTYLFQNTGSDTSQFDNTDFFVKLTGTVGVISNSNLIQ